MMIAETGSNTVESVSNNEWMDENEITERTVEMSPYHLNDADYDALIEHLGKAIMLNKEDCLQGDEALREQNKPDIQKGEDISVKPKSHTTGVQSDVLKRIIEKGTEELHSSNEKLDSVL